MKNRNDKTLNLTKAPVAPSIIKFTLPLMWGNLFQQLYNVVDSLIVGNFVGKEALAAVTSSSALIFLMVGFFNGLFTGTSVVIARRYGAKDYDKVNIAVHTSLGFSLICGIFLTVLGSIFTPLLLKLMNTPESVMADSITYFRIYFFGVIFVVLYNTANSIFRAIGDSKSPLTFLIISSVSNVVFDLIFVAVFDFGVGGAAFATVISQGISVLFSFYKLLKSDECYAIKLNKIRVDKQTLNELLKMGIPTGIQNSVTGISHVFMVSFINNYGAAVIAGFGTFRKVQQFLFVPFNAVGLTMSTYVGQNIGAKEYQRAKKGAIFGLILEMVLAELAGIMLFFKADIFIKLFNQDPEVLLSGARCAHICALAFFLMAFSNCAAGILQGYGKPVVSMSVSLGSWCLFRVIYLYIAESVFPGYETVAAAYPVSWALSSLLYAIYLFNKNGFFGKNSTLNDNRKGEI